MENARRSNFENAGRKCITGKRETVFHESQSAIIYLEMPICVTACSLYVYSFSIFFILLCIDFRKYTDTDIVRSLGCFNDIAIQWEWSNFDPSQNPNPLTEYDKTLHTSTKRTRNPNLCQSTVRERLGKYVKYKALSFFILIYFSPDSPTEVTRACNFTHDGSKHAL